VCISYVCLLGDFGPHSSHKLPHTGGCRGVECYGLCTYVLAEHFTFWFDEAFRLVVSVCSNPG